MYYVKNTLLLSYAVMNIKLCVRLFYSMQISRPHTFSLSIDAYNLWLLTVKCVMQAHDL